MNVVNSTISSTLTDNVQASQEAVLGRRGKGRGGVPDRAGKGKYRSKFMTIVIRQSVNVAHEIIQTLSSVWPLATETMTELW